MAELLIELIYLMLQFLYEENYKESAHRLESESGIFCNINYVKELGVKGHWEDLEKYLSCFIHINDSPHSKKMLFEIRKQKYLEALDRKDRTKALEILNDDLKCFKSSNEQLFKEMTQLITLRNFREKERFSYYTDTKTTRAALVVKLDALIRSHPQLQHKWRFPALNNSRLRHLINQSINWQHALCDNPNPNPQIKTLFVDHDCGKSQADEVPSAVANQLSLQRSTAPSVQPACHGQGTAASSSLPYKHASSSTDSRHILKRSRPSGISEEINNLPTSSVTHPGQSHVYRFNQNDLPINVISTITQGSDVKSLDFHPKYQTLLLVGTNIGDIALWEVGSRVQIAIRRFRVWCPGARSFALQASLSYGHPVFVNRVMWSPDGLFLGVAYSKHIVHIYSYRGGDDLRDHLEIEAHAGNVSDLAFTIRDQKLFIITCGEDMTVRVWDGETGANQYTFEGHVAPVYSVCPHQKENIQFILSTSTDGKIKAWVYNDSGFRLDYDAPGNVCTRMAYSTDGLRLFSCGSREYRDSHLVEWDDSEGTVKRTYLGLKKQSLGVVQFDTNKRLLVAGDEFSIKFWDIDNIHLLTSTHAEGGLPASPCVRFNKDGILLAVSTSENSIKILGNAAGFQLVRSTDNQADASRVASRIVAKATTNTTHGASSSAAGASMGFHDRSIPKSVMDALQIMQNQDRQKFPVVPRRTQELELSEVWKPNTINEPSQLRYLRLPENVLEVQIVRLLYVNSGNSILALADNAVLKLWTWKKSTGKVTSAMPPELWQPTSGILMINNIEDANKDDTVPCLALSNNDSYVLSASGGRASLFNLGTFKAMRTFACPPPAATCLTFHPKDNNIIAIGMSDSSIHIYNYRDNNVMKILRGHHRSVTGLAFCIAVLVSAGADSQLCSWKTETWELQASTLLKIPHRQTSNPRAETRVMFNFDQTRLLVIHETQLAIVDPVMLGCVMQWVLPQQSSGSIRDAVFSCDGESIFVGINDGSVNILTARDLRPKCRIDPKAYMPPFHSWVPRVCPNAIASHPTNPNQFALGLSDGGVYVLEPLESEKDWGRDPSVDIGAGPSTAGASSSRFFGVR